MKEIVRQYGGTVVSSVVTVLLLLLIFAVPQGKTAKILAVGGEVAREQNLILTSEGTGGVFDAYWGAK